MNKEQLSDTNLSSNIIVNVKGVDSVNTNELPGYETSYSTVELNTSLSMCWNCCHKYNPIFGCGLPLKYGNNVFTTTGFFCSYPCISRYIIDSKENVFDKLSLLNLYVNITNKTTGKGVIPAPSRLFLTAFGGSMDIEEYRGVQNSLKLLNIEPIINHINLTDKTLPITKININDNKNKYKLYRRNNKKYDNSIYSSMNLIYNKQSTD